VRKLILHLIQPFFGKSKYQRYFEALHRISLTGMHYGGGSDPESSGERAVLEHVRSSLRRSYVAPYLLFDVGANRGDYSLLLLECFGNEGRINAFEPSRATFELLQHTIGCRAKLCNHGFGDCEGTFVLHSDSDGSGLASLYDRNLRYFGISLSHSEQVSIATVDNFCATERIERIHLLKLDVEGHELKVLEGATEMLRSGAIDFIQFEFGGCNIDSKTYFRDFYELLVPQYRIFRVVKDGLRPISAYREIDEIFTTTNYLAELQISGMKNAK
jgi:FkbM family methyltransferase